MQANHEIFMQRCLQLARLGEYDVAPNPMVGAVLVNSQGQILGEGWHRQYGGPHAEVNCLANAEQRTGTIPHPEACTLYVNLEPCSHYGKTPPCADLILRKGIGQVVVGCLDPNPQVAGKGVQRLQNAGVKVVVGVAQSACRELNKRFLCLQEKHRPYVILKWAQTQDGYLDWVRTQGNPLAISTPLTKQLVHQQRAQNMAILVGTRTVLLDNPRLLTTHWSGRHPVRVTLDRHHILPPDSRIFSSDAPTIVYSECTEWAYILQDLAQRNIHSILVEGGKQVLEHILSTGLYDEIHVEVSPLILAPPSPEQGVLAPRVNGMVSPQSVDGHTVFIQKNT